jgi:hypothetical protein
MDPETVQIDFEWARNLERPHGGFNFRESCLILAKPGPVGTVSEFAFKISQNSVQLVDAMNVEMARALTARANSHDALQSLALIFFFFSPFLRRGLGKRDRVRILKGSYFAEVFET